MIRLLPFALAVAMIAGCAPKETPPPAPTAPAPAPAEQPAPTNDAAPGATMPEEGEEVAVMETNYGRIVLKFFPEQAPKHVENFKKLAGNDFYDGTLFHRVIPGFMIQGGDPNSRKPNRALHGQGGPGYTVDAEFNDIPFTRGIIGAARTQDPNSAGSQFYIMHARSPHLDGQYTAFGQVVQGMSVVERIANLPTDPNDNPLEERKAVVDSVRIERWPLEQAQENP
jgi:peptidyl-prolyl cis-trans isomerase B (cyclophilin B)